MNAKFIMIIASILSIAPVAIGQGQNAKLPITPKKPVTDKYHGVKVTENYRWLEDAKSKEVREWSNWQNGYTRSILDSLPDRTVIVEKLNEYYKKQSSRYGSLRYVPGMLFSVKSQPPFEQPFLVVLDPNADTLSQRVVVDPNQIDTTGGTSIDYYRPSYDGRYVAVSLSKGGSEKGTAFVYETATGKALSDTVPRVNNPTAGGGIAWNTDATGFYYTRYPQGNERPASDMDFYQQVYFHKIGTNSYEDKYIIGKDFPRIAEIDFSATEDGRYILATVENGDGGEFQHYLMNPSGEWVQVTTYDDRITKTALGPDTSLYLLSLKDSPRGKVLRVRLNEPDIEKAAIIVPESESVIQFVTPTENLLYVADLVEGGIYQVRIFDHNGKFQKNVPIQPVSSVGSIIKTSGDKVLFSNESYITPSAWFAYEPSAEKPERTNLFSRAAADFSDIEINRVFATSKDGTKVPMTIMMPKGTVLDGTTPTLLTAYGGYGISQTPGYNFHRRIWFDQGGIFVIANIRGGGEYGEEWHLDGNLTKKQNDYDDFAACAQYLIDNNYTSPAKLAIEGGSNGGLLMGVAMTQHPELFRVVISHAGIYDMLRVELDPNGEFNTTEFGTVKNPEHFKALYSYSPYHNVIDGAKYPAALFLAGDNDGRVNPANSRKMVARLQEASASSLPILLRTSSTTGHGIGSALSEVVAVRADVYAFLFYQLGIKINREQ